VLDGRERGGAGPAVVPGDQHIVGVGLGDARGHRAHAAFRYQLHADTGARVHGLEVVDQLRQILDRVDVVVRWGGNELDPRHRVPQPGNQLAHLVCRELPALAGLGSLDDLDLELLRPGQVLGGDAEPCARHLLDPIVGPVAVGEAVVVVRILAAFA